MADATQAKARKAIRKAQSDFERSQERHEQIREKRREIGILLMTGVAHDATIFAVLVIAINVAKMYRLNCVQNAPQVRGCLSRDILTLRRADCLNARGVPVPVESGQPGRSRFTELSEWLWSPTAEHPARQGVKQAGESLPAAD
jgi:hypothetical protein